MTIKTDQVRESAQIGRMATNLLASASLLALAFTMTPTLMMMTPVQAFECTNSGAAAAVSNDNGNGDSLACGSGASVTGTNFGVAVGRSATANGTDTTALGGIATFGGEGAIAASFTARLNQNAQVNVGIGSGFSGDSLGARIGAVYGW